MLRVTGFVFGPTVMEDYGLALPLAIVAGTTIVLGSLAALAQDNLKRRLAYSTISQLAYIVLGAALANSWGFLGGSMHIAMHAFGKITLFFCAGAVLVGAHKSEISQMDGLGRRMPFTFGHSRAVAKLGAAAGRRSSSSAQMRRTMSMFVASASPP